MDNLVDKTRILERVKELMTQHNNKIDSANVLSPDAKPRSEGYLEALYQVENILINF